MQEREQMRELVKKMDNELLDLVEVIRGDESLDKFIYISVADRVITEYKIKRQANLK